MKVRRPSSICCGFALEIQRGGNLCVWGLVGGRRTDNSQSWPSCVQTQRVDETIRQHAATPTHQSFVYPHVLNNAPDKDDSNKRTTRSSTTKKNNDNAHVDLNSNPYLNGLGGPTLPSTLLTVAFYVGVLFIVEHVTRYIIGTYLIHLDPILEIEVNRHIIARHIWQSISFRWWYVLPWLS